MDDYSDVTHIEVLTNIWYAWCTVPPGIYPVLKIKGNDFLIERPNKDQIYIGMMNEMDGYIRLIRKKKEFKNSLDKEQYEIETMGYRMKK